MIVIISASLSSTAWALLVHTCRLSHLSVCVSVSVRKVYCGKTADPDAAWSSEWGRSTDGCRDRRREEAVLGVNLKLMIWKEKLMPNAPKLNQLMMLLETILEY